MILWIDTAGRIPHAGLTEGGVLRGETVLKEEREQARLLIPAIQDMLAQADCDFAQIERVCVNRGPGSFTGVRIGLAAARHLGLALAIPVDGYTAFEGLLSGAGDAAAGKACAVWLDSRRGDVFVQRFDAQGRTEGAAEARDPAGMQPDDLPVVSDVRDVCKGALYADRADFAALSGLLSAHPDGRAPEPLYMRAAAITGPQGT